MNTAVPMIALAGSPNSGKSSLFNSLTGLHQKVGNYPGVTVEKKFGYSTTPAGRKVMVVDLPGSYSLDAVSLDEQVSIDVLRNKGRSAIGQAPRLVVAVADATNLERTLGLVLELKTSGFQVITVLNMMDLALKRGLKINLMALTKELGCPVVQTVASRKVGVDELMARIDQFLASAAPVTDIPTSSPETPTKASIGARFSEVDRILTKVMERPARIDLISRRIDAVVLHPILGTLILGAIMLLMFQAVFSWAGPVAALIESGVTGVGSFLGDALPDGFFRSLVVDGMIPGVGAVLVFLPQILLLFFFINLLEGSGYMMRAAFLLDQHMSRIGLQGKSFVPLLSSFACAIPGIMATRTIRSERERLLTILVAPLMTCSARLPVYTLLISGFVPQKTVFGGLQLQGLVMFGLFLIGIASAVAVAALMKTFAIKGPLSPFLLEMPSYKWPNFSYIGTSLWLRTKSFLRKAGTYILLIAMILWFLATFPRPPQTWSEPPINYSFAGRLGHMVEPVLKPIGFDWRIATGLIPGFMAREVMVGALATVFAVEHGEHKPAGGEPEGKQVTAKKLQDKISSMWSLATGLSLLVWYIFAPQCAATLATVRRETGSWKWPTFVFAYMLTLAYVGAFLTYQITTFLLS